MIVMRQEKTSAAKVAATAAKVITAGAAPGTSTALHQALPHASYQPPPGPPKAAGIQSHQYSVPYASPPQYQPPSSPQPAAFTSALHQALPHASYQPPPGPPKAAGIQSHQYSVPYASPPAPPVHAVKWKWESDDGQSFNDFSLELCKILEQQFKSGQTQYEIPEKFWRFDFKRMIQTNTRTGSSRGIRRYEDTPSPAE